MNRRELVAVTAIVAVLGLAAAAATLDSAIFETAGPGGLPEPEAQNEGLGPTSILYVYLAVVLFATFAVIFAVRSDDLTPTQLVGLTAALAVGCFVVVGFLSMTDARITQDLIDSLSSSFGSGADAAPPGTSNGSGSPPPGDGDGTGSGGAILTVGLLGAFLALVGVGVVVVGRMLRSPTEPTRTDSGSQQSAIARAAGRAAAALEDEHLGNPVYRAWAEMIDGLPVDDPETTTPAAFARAAIDAGLDPADVSQLTDLFREVRYGEAELTDERVERATAALRRIEATHGADESGGERS